MNKLISAVGGRDDGVNMGKLASVNTLSIVLLHQPKLNSITYKPIGIPFNRYLYVLPIDRYEYHIVNHLKALAGILHTQ